MGKKWNADDGPSEKLLSLYTMLLFSGREASLGELADELDCSKATVLRLVKQLEASRFGKLLRDKRGRESVYRIDKPKRLPKISLNVEGLHQLALCRDFIVHLLPESMRKSVDTTLQQASAYLPEDAGAETDGPGDLLLGASFTKGRINYSPFQDILRACIRGIREQKVCMVGYRSSIHAEPRDFEFAPKRLVAYRESIHIHGWLVTEKGTANALHENATTFALHRMTRAVVSRRGAAHLPDVTEEHKGAFGVMEGEPFTLRVRFSSAAATYVAEREWSAGQMVTVHKDGSVTLTMTARSAAEVISWVLSFGDAAEIVSPKWLREELAEQVRVLAARYAGKERQ